jgi:3-hydroxy-9,10-secoandrosta-1,3,5(10)-triene-9,17-dione monooxygenase reductase component
MIEQRSIEPAAVNEEQRVNLSFEDPFLPPVEDRRVDRRVRGRLLAPVTVWTAGTPSTRAGLTVSSVLVAEGEPPEVVGLLDPLSEVRQLLEEHGRFVLHVLQHDDRRLASSFAGKYPVDPYEGLDVEDTDYGPLVTGARTVMSCRFTRAIGVGYQDLVTGVIEGVAMAEPVSPLGYYRGRFRTLAEEPGR